MSHDHESCKIIEHDIMLRNKEMKVIDKFLLIGFNLSFYILPM